MTVPASLPNRVKVYEVGPRDGLQNEPQIIPLDVKVQFIDLLSAAGLPAIEVTSFVRPGVIPQLEDAEQVLAHIRRRPATQYTALVPNMRGMERALRCRPGGIALFTAASESFSRRNVNASIAETFVRFGPVVEAAKAAGIPVRGYVSTAFGCPYEGDVPYSAVLDVARKLRDLDVAEIVLSDTIGVATPKQVAELVKSARAEMPVKQIALHFHDTRGTALANVLASLQLGITTFDSSAGGLGGCPFAPGATGNLATEDLLYMLDGLDIETGVSLSGVVEASQYLFEQTGRMPSSRYFRAAVS